MQNVDHARNSGTERHRKPQSGTQSPRISPGAFAARSRPPRGRGMTKRSPLDNPALAEHAAEIRRLGKRAVEDVIEIGRLLTECKRICGHGNWLPWLDREFGWTEMTATRFINVYEMSKSNKLLDLELPISGLYLLAAPSTPKEARDQIIERAQAGETVPVAEVKRTIKRTKGHKQPASKPRERKSAEEKIAYEAGRLLGTLEI